MVKRNFGKDTAKAELKMRQVRSRVWKLQTAASLCGGVQHPDADVKERRIQALLRWIPRWDETIGRDERWKYE